MGVRWFCDADDLAIIGGSSVFDPASAGATGWLRAGDLVGADGLLIASLPDRLGGSAATQTVDAQKPVLATSGNGKRILALTNESMAWPLQAGVNNQPVASCVAFWYRPNSLTGTKTFWNVNTQAGGASAVRMNFTQVGDELAANIFSGVGVEARRGITTSDPLIINEWCFITLLYDGTGATEAERCRILLNGSPIALTFAANPTTASMPATLQQPTGNGWLFGTSAGGSPLTGEIGPDIWSFGTNPSLATLAQYQDYDIPT